MMIAEEEGYSVMITGITKVEADCFLKHIEKTPYYGVIGFSHFKMPKNDKMVDVFIFDCLNVKAGRNEIIDYWMKHGQKISQENIEKMKL